MAKHQREVSYLLEAPVEIVLLISENLAGADAVCFALACKALFSLSSRIRNFSILSRTKKYLMQRLCPEEQRALLTRLEKEVPGLVYDSGLNKLLHFDCHGVIKIKALWDLAKSNQFAYFIPMTRSYYWKSIVYGQMRLLRNYRLYGPAQGVPLSILSGKDRSPTTPIEFMQRQCESYVENSQVARWIGDELFLSCTKTMYLNKLEKGPVEIKALQEFIVATAVHTCHHGIFYGYKGTLETLYKNDALRSEFPQIEGKLAENSIYQKTGSCRDCETDWDVSISWNDSMSGLIITYITYHDLGNCSSPSDLKWTMINVFNLKPGRFIRGARPGDVKGQWIGET
ncbi:hypothetical protein F5Y12DRAFT_789968 [Xylaria sp. FL1777]|nr:hypothetical protein F5Y12DRAFT_789968 [Xylaria sp. FL1777]